MRYIAYVRKSSVDEGAQILSIDCQIDEIKKQYPDLNIIKIVRESRSAHKPYNRPAFEEVIQMIGDGKAEGLVSWHPDRLSREPITAGQIMHYLDNGKLKGLKFCSYTFENSPEGKLMLNFMLSQSKYFSDKLSKDVMRGMKKKCEMGQKPGKPTIGYMTDRFAEKGRRRHIQDPERYDLIRRCWDLMLTGENTVAHVLRETHRWGLTTRPTRKMPAKPMANSTIHKMFKNTYYMGEFEWGGETYRTDHPPMISPDEFERVQMILGNRHVPRPKKYKSLTSGLIKCPCGSAIVVDHKKKLIKTTGETRSYSYVRCSRSKKIPRCEQPPITQNDLESQIINYLDRIQISPAFHKWAIKHINTANKHEQRVHEEQTKSIQRAISLCDTKLNNLLELRISPENTDGSLISDKEYKLSKKQITLDRNKLVSYEELASSQKDGWQKLTVEIFDFACLARKHFAEGDVDVKKSILARIGANLLLKDGKLHMEGKRRFIVFEQHMPKVHDVENRGELEISRFGKAQKATLKAIELSWSK